MSCENCPYIMEELDRRMTFSNNLSVQECSEIKEDEEQYCWCEKIGGEILMHEHCGDSCPEMFNKINVRNKNVKFIKQYKNINSRKSRAYKYECDLRHKNHLKQLSRVRKYCCPVIYTDTIYIKGRRYFDNPKPYYMRVYRGRGQGRSSICKKASNRKIRRYKGEMSNGWWCHKLYDYWFEMY